MEMGYGRSSDVVGRWSVHFSLVEFKAPISHLSGSDPLASGFRPGPQGYGQDGV